mgnify:CR=1 FL=1
MVKSRRQQQIIDILRSKGYVEVHELCIMFNVTNMTIRRDLDELEKKGVLIRSHGGAMLPEKDILAENPFEIRLNHNKEAKLAIASVAVTRLADGQKIFIGSGTTTHYMSQKIDNSRRLIVVTDAIHITSELLTRPTITLIQIGGDVRSNTHSATGFFAENMIRQFKFKSSFFGVTGIGDDGQLYVGSVVQLSIYQAVIESSSNITVLADSSKIGTEDFISIGRLSRKYTLITNKDAPEKQLKQYMKLGAEVITV